VGTHHSAREHGEAVGPTQPPPPRFSPAAYVRLTELIHLSRAGDAVASDALFAATYDDLRRLARTRLRATRRHTFLDTGSLVHESFLRFAGSGRLNLEDRAHFMRWACRVMRSVIVDIARRRHVGRRGAGPACVPLDVDPPAVATGADEILRVHQALDRLGPLDARMTHVVEMRYFGALTVEEIASALGLTARTVRRDWEKARVLLREVLH
jgi:RNA polymerase sigma factor (TIGR02999 family)